jgi:hypothetical protein
MISFILLLTGILGWNMNAKTRPTFKYSSKDSYDLLKDLFCIFYREYLVEV